MELTALATFFKNLTIITGTLYVLTSVMIILATDFMVKIQKVFIDFDEETIKKFLWAYLALFKIIFIVFVFSPYMALLMMS